MSRSTIYYFIAIMWVHCEVSLKLLYEASLKITFSIKCRSGKARTQPFVVTLYRRHISKICRKDFFYVLLNTGWTVSFPVE